MLPKTKVQIGIVMAALMACILGVVQIKAKAIAQTKNTTEQENKVLKAENAKLKSELKVFQDKATADAERGHFEKCVYKGRVRDVWVAHNSATPSEQPNPLPKPSTNPIVEYQPQQYKPSSGSCASGDCGPSRRGGRRGNRW